MGATACVCVCVCMGRGGGFQNLLAGRGTSMHNLSRVSAPAWTTEFQPADCLLCILGLQRHHEDSVCKNPQNPPQAPITRERKVSGVIVIWKGRLRQEET